jgi:hypothetical protein
MRKSIFLLFVFILAVSFTHAQLMTSRLIGKGSSQFGQGYGLFAFYDFNLAAPNKSIRLELFDFAFFPTKGEPFFSTNESSRGYLSIRAGYKHVFSEERTGVYVLPSAGYCRVFFDEPGLPEGIVTNGIAVAFESGYQLEVGERGNVFNFGLKYEYDRGSKDYQLQSIGLKVSYAFGLLRRRE